MPDCWIAPEHHELQCLGTVDTERHDVVTVWVWMTGTERAIDLTFEERERLAAASRVRPLAGAAERRRLAQRIGRYRAWAEGGRWGLWSVPVDVVEDVLAEALTRSARSGRRYPNVA